MGRFADGFHDRSSTSLEGLGIDVGLSGHWWKGLDRSGEGFMFDVSYDAQGNLFMFVSFYAGDPDGNQFYLFAQGVVTPGSTTAVLDVVVASGGMWGGAMDPADVMRDPFGTLTVEFPDCFAGSMALDVNESYEAMGFTDIDYDLARDLLVPGVACPTFDNNSLEMMVAQ